MWIVFKKLTRITDHEAGNNPHGLDVRQQFWSTLDEVAESVVIGEDFNKHVSEGNTGEELLNRYAVKDKCRRMWIYKKDDDHVLQEEGRTKGQV